MDEAIIRMWNEKVAPSDHVYILGDFAFRNARPIRGYTNRMNGYLHLIRGNHDKRSEQYENCFSDVADYREIAVDLNGEKRRVVMSHYFVPFYNGHRRGGFMLHGHTHRTEESEIEERLKDELRNAGQRCEAYNVGAMWQEYMPQTLEEIIARQEREILL